MSADDSILAEPGYLGRYGLMQAPFCADLDERFFYPDDQHVRCMQTLQRLAEQRDLLLLVTGEQGVGKSTLLQRFVAQICEVQRVCLVEADPMMNAERLLQCIAEGFGLAAMPGEAGRLLQGALYQHLTEMHHDGEELLLVVDDAHTLPGDALEALYLLADTEAGDGKLLRVMLFCDPHMDAVLRAPALLALRERITHTLDITPLTEEQTAQYLRHRLGAAGLAGPQPFSDKLVRRIYRGSHGVPARINELAHTVLSEGGELREQQAAPEPPPRSPLPMRIAAGAAVAMVMVLVAAIVMNGDDEPAREIALPAIELEPEPPLPGATGPAADAAPPTDSLPVPAVSDEPPPEAPLASDATATFAPDAGAAGDVPDPTTPGEVAGADSPAADRTSGDSPPGTSSDGGAAAEQAEVTQAPPAAPVAAPREAPGPAPAPAPVPRLTAISPATVSGSNEARTFTLSGEHLSDTSRVTVRWTGNDKTLPADRVEFVNAGQLRFRISTGNTADTWQVQVTEPGGKASNTLSFVVTAAPPPTATAAASAAVTRRDDWYLVQSGERYTLQLFSSHQAGAAERFIAESVPGGEIGYVHTIRDGRHWYSVLYGSYPDGKAARKAADALSASHPELKPWVRRLADIQTAIRQAREAAAAPPPTLPGSAAVATPPAGYESHSGWLWSQPPGHYTLQLLGTRTEASIRAFIDRHTLQGKAVYYRTAKDGDPWYVLVYGVYPDRAAADQARVALAPDLRKARPWARDFAGIHAELERAARR